MVFRRSSTALVFAKHDTTSTMLKNKNSSTPPNVLGGVSSSLL